MARKKATKSIKRKKTGRKQSNAIAINTVDRMEKDLRELPREIASQCRKQASAYTQQQNQLNQQFKKAIALTQAIKNKCIILANVNNTAAKRQLAAAKKALTAAGRITQEMNVKLKQIAQQIKSLTDKQQKFTALDKELSRFEKEWAKKAKKKAESKKVVKEIISSIQSHVEAEMKEGSIEHE